MREKTNAKCVSWRWTHENIPTTLPNRRSIEEQQWDFVEVVHSKPRTRWPGSYRRILLCWWAPSGLADPEWMDVMSKWLSSFVRFFPFFKQIESTGEGGRRGSEKKRKKKLQVNKRDCHVRALVGYVLSYSLLFFLLHGTRSIPFLSKSSRLICLSFSIILNPSGKFRFDAHQAKQEFFYDFTASIFHINSWRENIAIVIISGRITREHECLHHHFFSLMKDLLLSLPPSLSSCRDAFESIPLGKFDRELCMI